MTRIGLGICRLLVRLLPGEMRREHGAELLETLEQRLEEERAGVAVREVVDLAATVAREWWARPGSGVGGRSHQWGREMMGGIASDARYALRALVKRPGFAVVAVVTLAVGIGATTAIYTVVDSVLFRSLDFPEPQELAWVWGGPPDPSDRSSRWWTSWLDYQDYVERQTSFEELAAFRSPLVTLTGEDQPPTRERAARVSANFFPTVRVEPVLGRAFRTEEDRLDGPSVVVLSHGLWVERFGADPDVLERELTVDGVSHVVVGVMPEGFEFPEEARLWLPLAPDAARDDRSMHRLILVGRLQDGVDVETAGRDVYEIAEVLAEIHPDASGERGAWAEPLLNAYVGDVRTTLFILLGATAFVLLIACVNVANLFLARTAARGGEVAVRTALGAGRGRIVRQLVVEGLLVALLGGIVGVGLGYGGLEAILALAPADLLPRIDEIALDGGVLLVATSATLGTVLLFGLAPALGAAGKGVGELLDEGGRGRVGGRGRLRGVLVVGETALAMALVVSAGLLLRSFAAVGEVDPGFEPEGRLVLPVSLPLSRYPAEEWHRIAAFGEELRSRTEALPGVRSAALAYAHPLDPSWTTSFSVAGRPEPEPARRPEASYRPATPGYFRTAGIRLLRGRDFRGSDDASAPGVVVVNRAFVREFFPDQDPLGRRIRKETWWEGTPEGEWEIVGVAGDVRFGGLERPPSPAFYFPHAQRPMNDMQLVAHLEGDAGPVVSRIRETLWELDPGLPADEFRRMEDILGSATAPRRFLTVLFGTFGAVALLLAAVGLFGVLSYSVGRRRREMGVRLSLGASAWNVVRLVVAHGMRLAAGGVLLGGVLALTAGRLLDSLLFGVAVTDIRTLAGVALVLLTVACGASTWPAVRAARVDPVRALRSE